ncbi:MAG: protein-L-isoaspartate(D-aspartate) O-methyltransferase [Candidatus Thiothrix singaporensis]|uniref:Protein-L-isoaspartate O-methyltransferase n=1 Tax=Candidatus Thiothrix singaporensis TaxID=2799669 RepID=A0A7L6AYE1_9GAMM|nr:MAG: protein-L-isoaspartate(D-aspartate) O-methyltransferase [Candidatus Thiothrix singaporensis]
MGLRKLDIEGIGMTSQRTRNRLVARLMEKGVRNEAVLQVMSRMPRHLFVDEALASRSYEDTALPIGHGQTISQPYIVARMTELLLEGEKPPCKVLEVGTGSGYQAAILSPLVDRVFTVERVEPLFRSTQELLHALGFRNIHMFLRDGSWGLPQEAPFDAIIATAAPEVAPPALLEQLAVGGRLVIPVGKQSGYQLLQVIVRHSETAYSVVEHEAVQFVPMVNDKP